MKKTILFFFLATFSTLASANQCLYLFQNVQDDCEFGFNQHCTNLEYCQKRRTACPQELSDKKSCIEFNDCIWSEHKQSSKEFAPTAEDKPIIDRVHNDPTNSCKYSFNQKNNPSEQCQNLNIYNTAPWAACPGKGSFLDKFSDKNYDCEGHKEKVRYLRNQCVSSLATYIKACGDTVNGRPIPEEVYPQTCDGLKVDLRPMLEQNKIKAAQ